MNIDIIKKLFVVVFSFSSLACNNSNKPTSTSDSSELSEPGSEEDIYLNRPNDTNLEFWITQRVKSEDLVNQGCTYLPGWFGAEEYLDSRYEPITIEGMDAAPEIHVTYLLTGYPDVLDNSAITHIEITDPSITVYGLTLESDDQAIISRLEKLANSFSYVTTTEECYLSVKIKNCSFSFMSDKIVIDVPVTNNESIVF